MSIRGALSLGHPCTRTRAHVHTRARAFLATLPSCLPVSPPLCLPPSPHSLSCCEAIVKLHRLLLCRLGRFVLRYSGTTVAAGSITTFIM
jgi:hypothetical protein